MEELIAQLLIELSKEMVTNTCTYDCSMLERILSAFDYQGTLGLLKFATYEAYRNIIF